MREARQGELKALAVRKYLDALCVYFWAATSLLFSLFTFGLFVLLGHKLTAEVVFTSLALFNVLIAPLNSFPWVLNGIVEAIVSVRRLQNFLVSWETSSGWAYATPAQHKQAASSEPSTPVGTSQRNILAEGLTAEALTRADSSHLYTTINMERLPSALVPSFTSHLPLDSQPSLQQQGTHTLTTPPHPPSPLGRAPPPPPSAAPTMAEAGRLASTSFKDWGRSNTGLPSLANSQSLTSNASSRAMSHQEPTLAQQGSSADTVHSLQPQQSTALPPASDSQGSSNADQGIVTVVSDSSRLATASSLDGYPVVLSGASFSWHPTLGSSRVLTGKASHKQHRHRQSRQGMLRPPTGSQDDVALHEINLTVKTGSLLLVMGEIGSGACPAVLRPALYCLFLLCPLCPVHLIYVPLVYVLCCDVM